MVFKNLIYLTYQVFPNEKANNLQTIKMLENFSKQKIDSTLIFPDRGKFNKEPDLIFNFYNVKKHFRIKTFKHFLPFNYFSKFEKFNFLVSSFLWSFFSVNKISKSINNFDVLMTRTHWVLYFLSRLNNRIVYECHKYSKIENFIFRRLSKKKNIILIFSNNNLMAKYKISGDLAKNSLILESSFEEIQFNSNFRKNSKQVVFVGSLLRFNKPRNIEFLINIFANKMLKDYRLLIIGGPDNTKIELEKKIHSNNVKFLGQLSHQDSLQIIQESEIGILINSNDEHSELHTSPIKYFEYLRGGLKILAVDFLAHRNLPMGENNYYFKNNDSEDFIKKLRIATSNRFKHNREIENYSYESRVKKIINQVARLEGFEPPTF